MDAQLTAEARLARYEHALAGIEAPFAFVDLDAMWFNARDMLRRAGGKPIRVASKSLRSRPLLDTIQRSDPGFQGVLCFTLPEALWLASHGFDNLVVAYPTVDHRALAELHAFATSHPDHAPALMVDSVMQLDLIATLAKPGGEPIRVCIDFDASFWMGRGLLKLGAKRTPIHSPEQARALAEAILRRPKLQLWGMMCYEAHIAGVGDQIPGQPVRSRVIRWMQEASFTELRERRAAAVAAVEEIAPLQFVNAGGTGDLERVATEPAMTEASAGSGFFAPSLFDNYAAFTPEPAAVFALPIVRHPNPRTVTVLGGGYHASGVGHADRMPSPYLPAGLRLNRQEGAGEVQTPLHGAPARRMALGDRVYFRHTKAGELCERFDRLLLVQGSAVVDEVPTYRGEGKAFL